MKRLLLLGVLGLVGCRDTIVLYPPGPSPSGGGIVITNTNTNTNTQDTHDVINFAAAANPGAPVPAPGGGSETPLGLPAGAEALARGVANSNAALLSQACGATGNWGFLDRVVSTLAASDPRWGYLVKASTGLISADVIAYRATADTIGAWGVDVILDVCGANQFQWNVIGLDVSAQWSATRP
jgi:hypothetical protein